MTFTITGGTTRLVSSYRPPVPILGVCDDEHTWRQLALVWGVHPVVCKEVVDALEVSELACETVREEGFGTTGETVVISAGMPFGTPGTTNLLRIAQVK